MVLMLGHPPAPQAACASPSPLRSYTFGVSYRSAMTQNPSLSLHQCAFLTPPILVGKCQKPQVM